MLKVIYVFVSKLSERARPTKSTIDELLVVVVSHARLLDIIVTTKVVEKFLECHTVAVHILRVQLSIDQQKQNWRFSRTENVADPAFEGAVTDSHGEVSVDSLCQLVHFALEFECSLTLSRHETYQEWTMLLWVCDVLGELLRKEQVDVVVRSCDQRPINREV